MDGSAFMETLDARGTSSGGAVCFTGATIGDDLVLQGARLIAGAGPAFNGEILIVKETMNTMVEQLRAFASEVIRVAREVCT